MDQDDDTPPGYCGCDFVVLDQVGGRQVEFHHHWPDDGSPHAETSECGCGPQLHRVTDTLFVYDHFDQDADDPRWVQVDLVTGRTG